MNEMGAIEEKLEDQVIDDVKEIIKSQIMIDEIIVKNSDKISILMKVNGSEWIIEYWDTVWSAEDCVVRASFGIPVGGGPLLAV